MDHCDTAVNNKISLHQREGSAMHVNKPNLQKPSDEETNTDTLRNNPDR
jgi:hypothetical protein